MKPPKKSRAQSNNANISKLLTKGAGIAEQFAKNATRQHILIALGD